MNVSESVFGSIEKALTKGHASYTFSETINKTFIIPDKQDQIIKEDIFNGEPIRRLAIAMNTNSSFTGDLVTNPFHFKKFGLKGIRIWRNGQTIVNLDTTNDVESYYTTLQSLHFEHDGHGIPLTEYPNHYILVFDLTSTRESNQEVFYPEVSGAGLRIELYFNKALTETVEVYILGEKLSTIYIDADRKVFKNGG